MHKPMKYVEKGLAYVAKGAWTVFDALNSIKPERGVHPELVREAAAEVVAESEAAARLAARDRLAVPDVRARGAAGNSRRQARLQGTPHREDRRDQGDHHRARRQDHDGEGLPDPRPLRRRDGHGHGVLQAPRGHVPGLGHPLARRREAAQPRLVHDQVRPRLGAHDRPDESLQHDVRPVLHGREPGRLRARARLGRDQDAARQRDHAQAEAPDVGAVLRRRADAVAVLPRRGALRQEGRLQQRAGGDQRHRVRQEPGLRARGGRSGSALRLSAVRRHRQRGQLAPAGRQPVRRQAARHREPVALGRRHRSGHDHRQRREQRAGRAHHQVRARQPQEDLVPLVPAGVVHGPRRGDHRRAPSRAALHAVAPGARREEPDRHRRADARLVPDFVHGHVQRLGGPRARTAGRLGRALVRLPPELRRRHGRHRRQGNEGGGADHGVPERPVSSPRTSRR